MPRKVFVAGEILTAADVNTNLMDQAVMVFADSTARGSAIPSPSEGMITYLEDTDAVEKYDGSAFVAISQPGILQVVRATDTTDRTTASTTIADASISVSITPKFATSNLILMWSVYCKVDGGSNRTALGLSITDSSNTELAGGEEAEHSTRANASSPQMFQVVNRFAFVAAGSTAARTYKGRFRVVQSGPHVLLNSEMTGQLFAIEVAA